MVTAPFFQMVLPRRWVAPRVFRCRYEHRLDISSIAVHFFVGMMADAPIAAMYVLAGLGVVSPITRHRANGCGRGTARSSGSIGASPTLLLVTLMARISMVWASIPQMHLPPLTTVVSAVLFVFHSPRPAS